MRVLLLGGTAEARELAAHLYPGVEVVSSLAGRVPDPALPVGEVRIGGFGGVDGMRRWLVDSEVSAVVDATHPYAATITAHAAQVCGELGLPHLVLARPAWQPGDAILVKSAIEAAKTVEGRGYSRVFLTTGRSDVKAFRDLDAWFLIRAVTAPDPTELAAEQSAAAVARSVPLRRRARPARRAPSRLSGDEEQWWRHDPAEARRRRRTGCRRGDGGPSTTATGCDHGVHRGRCGRLGQIDRLTTLTDCLRRYRIRRPSRESDATDRSALKNADGEVVDRQQIVAA